MHTFIKNILLLSLCTLSDVAIIHGSLIQQDHRGEERYSPRDLACRSLKLVGISKNALGTLEALPAPVTLHVLSFMRRDWERFAIIPLKHNNHWIERVSDLEPCGGNRIAVLSGDRKAIHLYDAERSHWVTTIIAREGDLFGKMHNIPACGVLAVPLWWNKEKGRLIKLFSRKTGEYRASIRFNPGSITSSAVISDKYLALGKSDAGEIEIIDISQRRSIQTLDGRGLFYDEGALVGLSGDRIASLHEVSESAPARTSRTFGGGNKHSIIKIQALGNSNYLQEISFAEESLKKNLQEKFISGMVAREGIKPHEYLAAMHFADALAHFDKGQLGVLSDGNTLTLCSYARACVINLGTGRAEKALLMPANITSFAASSGMQLALVTEPNYLDIVDCGSEKQAQRLSGSETSSLQLSHLAKVAQLDNNTAVASGISNFMVVYKKNLLDCDYRISKPLGNRLGYSYPFVYSGPAHKEEQLSPQQQEDAYEKQQKKLADARQDQIQFYKEKFSADPDSIPTIGKRSKLQQAAFELWRREGGK